MNPDAQPALDDLEWVGGHPALDFVNTVSEWRGDEPGEDYLAGYPELLEWNRLAGLVATTDVRRLGRGNARARARALRQGRELRGALHRLFRALADGHAVPRAPLAVLNDTLRGTLHWRGLGVSNGNIVSKWIFDDAPPAAVLGPVAWRAADLLERGDLGRLKRCPGDEGCDWIFLDTSRNRSRTWCSMKTCGNLAKVRRFRRRQR